MRTRSRQRKGIVKESLSAALIVALLAPALGAGERRGAQVIVTKREGGILEGELLAVKGLDLVLLDTEPSLEGCRASQKRAKARTRTN
jgi:hypothetical protein